LDPTVFIFVALPCEAKPFIQAWNLKKNSQHKAFSIYVNQDRVVVVSGVGKLAMAAAVAYTLCLYSNTSDPILVNVGIAGHRDYPLGNLYLADKVSDIETLKNYYPQLTFSSDIPTSAVTTLSKPSTDYDAVSLFDMEAAAFYEIATKFSTNEFIHSVKIISDNSSTSIEHISEAIVIDWVANKVNDINQLLTNLLKARELLPKLNNDLYSQLIQQVHFSEANAVKLKGLMQRWQIVTGNSDLKWAESGASSGKELIVWIEQQLEKKTFNL
jgi:nucleoside phosphorylase